MKTFRNIALAFGFLLLVTSQVAWAIAPGSGHNKDKKDKQLHSAEGPAMIGPEEAAPLEIVAEDDIIAKPATTESTENVGIVKKQSSSKKSTNTRKSESKTPEAESSVGVEEVQKKESAAHSDAIGGAVSRLIVLLTSLDRDELPVSDTTVAIFLFLMFLIPPFTVLVSTGEMKSEFWFNVLLTCFLWVPGLVHASVVLHRQP